MSQFPKGYPHSIFILDNTFNKDKLQKYECLICLNILREPFQCQEGHMFCFDCGTVEKCPDPMCGIDLGLNVWKNKFVKNQMYELSVICPNKECNWPNGTLSKLDDHLANACLYVVTKCLNHISGCLFESTRQDVNNHVLSCPYSTVKCMFEEYGCIETSQFKDIDAHQNSCPHKQIVCPNKCCIVDVLKATTDDLANKDLKKHLSIEQISNLYVTNSYSPSNPNSHISGLKRRNSNSNSHIQTSLTLSHYNSSSDNLLYESNNSECNNKNNKNNT